MPCELDPPQKFRTCLPVWLACCCLLACFARSSEGRAGLAGWLACCLLSWTGWASQAHMLMLAHVVASSQSESIVLCGFLVVYVAMPAPRPSSQAADLRSDAFRASGRHHLAHLTQGCSEGCGEECRLSASLPLAAGHRVAVWGRTCGGRHSEYMYLPLGSALHVG